MLDVLAAIGGVLVGAGLVFWLAYRRAERRDELTATRLAEYAWREAQIRKHGVDPGRIGKDPDA